MAQAAKMQKTTRRERWAWYLYDFGNSAYAAVVLLAVFSAYFKGEVVGGAEGSRLWGVSVGIAMLIVAVSAPFLGTVADFSGSKKRFLFFFTAMAVIFTGLLFFVQAGDVVMGGNGWAIGSLGGILCLVLALALIMLIGGTIIVRLTLPITALYFALSSIPIFLWLREKAEKRSLPEGETYFTLAISRLKRTVGTVRNYREFIKFIVSFLIYNDGILMTMNFAAILGAVLYGMEQQQLIIFMILVQVTSVAGAYIFGIVADRVTAKRALVISMVLMLAAVIWMYFNYSLTGFYLIGGLAGFALTGVQSVSRAMVGKLAPDGKSAEFYGFFAVAGRTSSFIGPTVYGWLAAEAALWYEAQGLSTLVAEQSGQRIALLSIIAFLLVGMVLLLSVNEREGVIAASAEAIAAD